MSKQFNCQDTNLQEAIRVSCTYERIKYQLIEQMWKIMIAERIYQQNMGFNSREMKEAIIIYNRLWKEWNLLKQSSPWCATLYTDMAFRNQTKGSIGELVNVCRRRIYCN